MADIHILEGNKLKNNIWEYRVAFHIPINTPNTNVTDPTFKSEVPDISSTELSDIQAGTMKEVIKSYRYNTSIPISDYKAMLQQEWSKIHTEVNNEYNKKYQFYLVKLTKQAQKVM